MVPVGAPARATAAAALMEVVGAGMGGGAFWGVGGAFSSTYATVERFAGSPCNLARWRRTQPGPIFPTFISNAPSHFNVVHRALVAVQQNLLGLVDSPEVALGALRRVGIVLRGPIGMPLQRRRPVGFRTASSSAVDGSASTA